ncbi:MAG: hypothetical protein QNJ56_03955, partial [Gammaproteobacteria bacterium]|nr:hypothetical protein [Gammaproteobacteria bacterium]
MKLYKKILQMMISAWLVLCSPAHSDTLTLSLQDTNIRDAMLMLSKQERLNIFVGEGVDGSVTVNIYNMDTLQAIQSIAESAGFAMERRDNSIFIVNRDDAGKYRQSNLTQVRTFKVQYANPTDIEGIVKEHLSEFG